MYAEFIVDPTGRVQTDSFKALQATHPDFVASVRTALASMTFITPERGSAVDPDALLRRVGAIARCRQ